MANLPIQHPRPLALSVPYGLTDTLQPVYDRDKPFRHDSESSAILQWADRMLSVGNGLRERV